MVVLAVAALFLVSRFYVRYIEARHPPAGRFVISDGRRWHVVEVGEAQGCPAVVLLHGAATNAQDIAAPLMARLAPATRVIAPDRPGHGYSSRQRQDRTPEAQADALWRLLDGLQVGEVVLVGHSWSGSLALAMALEQPERVVGVVQISAVMRPWKGDVSLANRLSARRVIGSIVSNTLVVPVGRLVFAKAVKKVFSPAPVPEGYIESTSAWLSLRPADFAANAADMAALNNSVARLSKRYGELKMPITVLGGEGDNILSTRFHFDCLKASAPQAIMTDFKGQGHLPHYGEPEQVAAAIRAML